MSRQRQVIFTLIIMAAVLSFFLGCCQHYGPSCYQWMAEWQHRWHLYWNDNPPAMRDDEMPPGTKPAK